MKYHPEDQEPDPFRPYIRSLNPFKNVPETPPYDDFEWQLLHDPPDKVYSQNDLRRISVAVEYKYMKAVSRQTYKSERHYPIVRISSRIGWELEDQFTLHLQKLGIALRRVMHCFNAQIRLEERLDRNPFDLVMHFWSWHVNGLPFTSIPDILGLLTNIYSQRLLPCWCVDICIDGLIGDLEFVYLAWKKLLQRVNYPSKKAFEARVAEYFRLVDGALVATAQLCQEVLSQAPSAFDGLASNSPGRDSGSTNFLN